MAKFFGVIGYADQIESGPGVWIDVITEVEYQGDIVRNTRQLQDGQKVNDDISIQNSISIVADAYANEHIFAMRYVRWMGGLWTVDSVEVQAPRLLLRLGGVYNGQVATPSDS